MFPLLASAGITNPLVLVFTAPVGLLKADECWIDHRLRYFCDSVAVLLFLSPTAA